MAVKWIGDAAQELGIHPLDAVEILASRQEYPMNGLVDEDRFKTLRLMRGGKRLETSGSQPVPAWKRKRPDSSRKRATRERPKVSASVAAREFQNSPASKIRARVPAKRGKASW